MFTESPNHLRLLKLKQRAEWSAVWHPWTVLIPRRSITGRLVHGQVWRRYDGRRWIYKKLIPLPASPANSAASHEGQVRL